MSPRLPRSPEYRLGAHQEPDRADQPGHQVRHIALPLGALEPRLVVGRRPNPDQPPQVRALAIYFVNLGIAFFIQRPNLRRLIGVRAAADDKTWLERARRQRYVSYLMAGLVGTIGFLMSSKPVLW